MSVYFYYSNAQSTSLSLIGKTSSKIFYATQHHMTWYEAKDYCEEYGFSLASIETIQENQILEELAERRTEAIECKLRKNHVLN